MNNDQELVRIHETLSEGLKDLRGGNPERHEGVRRHGCAATAPKALDGKTKELIALAISVALRCDDCVGFHARAAVEKGASREEVLEALGMAIYMGAGPSVMYANHALEAFAQYANKAAEQGNPGAASRPSAGALASAPQRGKSRRGRRHGPARAAPGRPEVGDDRNVVRSA